MSRYQKLNIAFGWITFIIAAFVYLSTIEPTASFWDCGEFIATAFKLEVGHPPGAPLFQLVGRVFSLFTSDITKVASMVNALSALASALTILFLFWTVTALAKKIATRNGKILTEGSTWAIIGSGLVGALAYTFSDSFWFSAVEGEVYASSSLFTALVFWAIFKWDAEDDEDIKNGTSRANRWIVLIAYLMGLSLGVHLLNLLCIPAIVLMYYFKKFKITPSGLIIASIVSVVILGTVQVGIVQYLVKIASWIELFFVNSLGMPFNSGVLFFMLALVGGLVFGLYYTQKNGKVIQNTILLCFAFLVLGYSTFTLVVIRSLANPPMDENNPENVFALLSYLNREQYGDRPLAYGQQFNAQVVGYDDGATQYAPGKDGKYVVTDDRKSSIPKYDDEHCSIFPRMYSSQGNHKKAYMDWAAIKKNKEKDRPTMGENLSFFFKYQVGFMYFRYFMWNFAGRQNDVQGSGELQNGNWISGIPFIDSMMLGSQDKIPDSFKRNKGTNKLYFLPLILGLIGLFFHFNSEWKGATTVFLLFFFTGLAIVIYLNQTPYQPRERDYAYVGSFYAFAIWIGIGVIALYEWLSDKLPQVPTAIATTALCLLLVPTVMAKAEWNDHDRSNRYTCRDFAKNYLASCAPNAVLFTNGDNDTFPLWYVQEVEGFRTDVRVINLSLLNTDWYIDQMERDAYDGKAVPFSLKHDQYVQGTRDVVPVYEKTKDFVDAKEIMRFIACEDQECKLPVSGGKLMNFIPTKKIHVGINRKEVLENNVVPDDMRNQIVSKIDWTLDQNYLMKNHLMVLDLIANNDWKRPIYFAITVGSDNYLNLEKYFQLEGLAYRFVPVQSESPDGQTGRVATDIMYENLINKFAWGNMQDPNVYLEETNMRMTMNFRNNFARLADALYDEATLARQKKNQIEFTLKNNMLIAEDLDSLKRELKKQDARIEEREKKVVTVLDKCIEIMPDTAIPFNYFVLPIAELYYKIGTDSCMEKGKSIVTVLANSYEQEVNYYLTLDRETFKKVEREAQLAMSVWQRISMVVKQYDKKDKDAEWTKSIENRFEDLQKRYMAKAS